MSNEETIQLGMREKKVIEKVTAAREFKNKGNDFFKKQEYKKALHQYHNGILYLKGVHCDITPAKFPIQNNYKFNFPNDFLESVDNLNADLHNNVAACLLKHEPVRYDRVLECCEKVTSWQEDNAKGWYRMGLACYHLHDTTKAKEALEKANKISLGKDSAICKLTKLVDNKLKEEDEKYKSMFKNSLLK